MVIRVVHNYTSLLIILILLKGYFFSVRILLSTVPRRWVLEWRCSLTVPAVRISWTCVVSFAPSPLDPGESARRANCIYSKVIIPCGGGLEYLHRSPCES
jgi:hypothetical protein